MGSKASMLTNGLGNILLEELQVVRPFIDLFSGSGSVARWVASRSDVPVTAVDIQEYGRILAGAVLDRHEALREDVVERWRFRAESHLNTLGDLGPTSFEDLGYADVMSARAVSEQLSERYFITRHYGGHYFSLKQAATLDALRLTLPKSRPERIVALAALIEVASDVAAAPGHTAQPFQPTERLRRHIQSAWKRDVLERVSVESRRLSALYSPNVASRAVRRDALRFAHTGLPRRALVFCDPPYSAVQYSRFYHVLEGIARGGWPSVGGAGRAPDRDVRYASPFSLVSASTRAFSKLFALLAEGESTVIVTFPNHLCSNGQDAQSLAEIASEWFAVETHIVLGQHSSLGAGHGAGGGRTARRAVEEAVLVLRPARSARMKAR